MLFGHLALAVNEKFWTAGLASNKSLEANPIELDQNKRKTNDGHTRQKLAKLEFDQTAPNKIESIQNNCKDRASKYWDQLTIVCRDEKPERKKERQRVYIRTVL